MYALMATVQQNLDTLEDAIRLFKFKGAPAAQMQKGFQGVYLLTNSKTGKAIVLSMWDSKDDAVNTERSGYYQSEMKEFNQHCAKPPVLEGYEVSVQVQ